MSGIDDGPADGMASGVVGWRVVSDSGGSDIESGSAGAWMDDIDRQQYA